MNYLNGAWLACPKQGLRGSAELNAVVAVSHPRKLCFLRRAMADLLFNFKPKTIHPWGQLSFFAIKPAVPCGDSNLCRLLTGKPSTFRVVTALRVLHVKTFRTFCAVPYGLGVLSL